MVRKVTSKKQAKAEQQQLMQNIVDKLPQELKDMVFDFFISRHTDHGGVVTIDEDYRPWPLHINHRLRNALWQRYYGEQIFWVRRVPLGKLVASRDHCATDEHALLYKWLSSIAVSHRTIIKEIRLEVTVKYVVLGSHLDEVAKRLGSADLGEVVGALRLKGPFKVRRLFERYEDWEQGCEGYAVDKNGRRVEEWLSSEQLRRRQT